MYQRKGGSNELPPFQLWRLVRDDTTGASRSGYAPIERDQASFHNERQLTGDFRVVIPAEAGIQCPGANSRLRGNDTRPLFQALTMRSGLVILAVDTV